MSNAGWIESAIPPVVWARLRTIRWVPLCRRLTAAAAAALAFIGFTPPLAAATAADEKPRLQIDIGVHSAPARRLSVAPARNLLVTASDDKTARVWDLATGQLRHVLRAGVGAGEVGRLYGAAIHPSEDWVAIAGSTGSASIPHRILIFSLASGRFLKAFDAKGGDIKHLAWSADGSALFAVYAGENAVRAFDTAGSTIFERRLAAPAYGLTASVGGQIAATALDGTILVMQARDGRVTELRTLRAREGEPVGVAFSPDGSQLLVGSLKQLAAPELFDLQRGVSLGPLRIPAIRVGNFMSVAWSADAKVLVAAGSARDHERRHDAFFFSAADGRLIGRETIATDTIVDIEPLPDNRFAYASFDGSWGVVSAGAVSLRVDASISGARGPEKLLISADAREVQWPFDGGERQAHFRFDTRQVTFGAAGSRLTAPVASAGWSDQSEWKDTRSPRIRGAAVPLGADETSRSLAYFSDRRTALLGTTQRLIRLDDGGRIRWEVRTQGEVWAVNLSADNRIAVTSLSDGSLRWWRTTDGTLLLSLYATRDGRWVTWTESGYFDASAGADRLAGWAVNRQDSPTADFFTLSRFRERFNRPERVDGVFRTLEPVAADTTLALPPVLESAERSLARPDPSQLAIPYSVRPGTGGGVDVEIRVDGRPAAAAKIVQQAAPGGQISGEVLIPPPPVDSLVQLVARNSNGVSEPLGFTLVKAAPPPAGPPPAAPPQAAQPPQDGASARPEAAALPTAIGSPLSDLILQPLSPFALPTAAAGAPFQTQSASISSAPLRGPEGRSRLFVLAVGVSQYRKPEYRLGLAAKDARDFSSAMQTQTGRLYADVLVRTLTDDGATKRSVIEQLHWLSTNVGPSDIGVLFFAGHGLNSQDGQYYFLAHDADHEKLAQTGIPEEEIRKALGRIRGKALLFVDTCFGGSALSRAGSSEIARMANNLSASENGVVVFASSSGRQLSEENDAWGNGAFTKAVLAGLSGKADLTRTGRVTFKGLDFFVSEEVRKLTDGRQTPVTISPTGVPDFTLARVSMADDASATQTGLGQSRPVSGGQTTRE